MAQSDYFNIDPEITCFSYDEDHKFHFDESSLRYYYPPHLPADLNKGFDTFKQLDDTADEHLDGLLEAIVAHEKETGARVETDLMTWRGMMTKIMVVPFSKLDSWEMNATLFQGTIFIEENHEKKLNSRERQNNAPARPGQMSQDLMSFWGYKFETLSLMPEPWSKTPREYIDNREEHAVSNYAQYCSIVRTGLGNVKMVIGGEVDAVLDFKPEDRTKPINWVELKTSAIVDNDREQVKFERKLLKFWAQSFLLGVPKIVVGYRTTQGVLRHLEELETQSLPEKVRLKGKGLWDGQTCINFAASFLEWLKSVITTEGVWRIRKREKAPVLEVFKLEDIGTGNILSDNFLSWRLKEDEQPKQVNSVFPIDEANSAATVRNGQGP